MSRGVASGIPSTSASQARPGYSADLATCQLLATTTSRGRGYLAPSQIAGPTAHAQVLLARPIKRLSRRHSGVSLARLQGESIPGHPIRVRILVFCEGLSYYSIEITSE